MSMIMSLYITQKNVFNDLSSLKFSHVQMCLRFTALVLFLFCADSFLKAQYMIKGMVFRYDTTRIALNGKVSLYEYKGDGKEDVIYDQLQLHPGDSGGYAFSNVIPGMYYVSVDFFDEDYVVSYFGGDIYWNDADVIIIDTFSAIATDIFISKKPNTMGGLKKIKGKIREGYKNRGPSDPIGGIDIGMMNSFGDLIGYERADSLGNFLIDSVIDGSYSFIANIAGIKVDTNTMYNINVGTNVDSVILNITVDSNIIYANVSLVVKINMIEDKPEFITLYPNPAHGDFLVDVSNEISKPFHLTIYNTERAIVYNGGGVGGDVVRINRTGLANGIYFIEIQIADHIYRKKVILH